MTDPRIQQFYDNAAAHGMTPGDYAIHLAGLPAILDVVELARQEEDEDPDISFEQGQVWGEIL